MSAGPASSAVLSYCGRYRYQLGRTWDVTAPADVWIMLNPSTADASQDDPTIRRCIGFSKRGGAGGLTVVNLFAYRATDPAELLQVLDPVGPENDDHLQRVFDAAAVAGGRIIGAWGAHKLAGPRAREMARLFGDDGWVARGLMTLGLTKHGAPRHPLYVPGDVQPAVWEPL